MTPQNLSQQKQQNKNPEQTKQHVVKFKGEYYKKYSISLFTQAAILNPNND